MNKISHAKRQFTKEEKDKLSQRAAQWRIDNRERYNAYFREYYEKRREERAETLRTYHREYYRNVVKERNKAKKSEGK